ncbi:MAG: hypothetical protein AB7V58_00725 [Solirubrobacterales bacterium]
MRATIENREDRSELAPLITVAGRCFLIAAVALLAALLGSNDAAFLAGGFAAMGFFFLYRARRRARDPQRQDLGVGLGVAVILALLGIAALLVIIGQP